MTARNQSLDVLRGIAILLVLGCHLDYYPMWAHIGWIGVDLFFVLSGFLVAGLMFREYRDNGDVDFKKFIFRRGLKIWPSFFVFMAFVSLTAIALKMPVEPLKLNLVFLFSLQNYVAINAPKMTFHTWSLAVEEHFYLLLPALLFVLVKTKRMHLLPWIGISAIPLCVTMRLLYGLPSGQQFTQSHLRLDSLFIGVLLSYAYYFRPSAIKFLSRSAWLPVALVCILPAFLLPERSGFMQTLGLTLMDVGFCLFLALALRITIPLRPLAYVGRSSYSIYLWHLPICMLLGRNSFATFWASIATCLAFGMAMSKLVEFPVLRLRDRYFPSCRSLRVRTLNSNTFQPASPQLNLELCGK